MSKSSSGSVRPFQKSIIDRNEWEEKLDKIKINRSDLDSLVLNYLVVEGYKEAAQVFQQESGLKNGKFHINFVIDQQTINLFYNDSDGNEFNTNGIGERVTIRNKIIDGDVVGAISEVNTLNPQILDSSPELFFKLKQQQLIELIKNGKIDDALRFAQEELVPLVEDNTEFLQEVEKVMSLLAFEDQNTCPYSSLLGNGQRQKTASELNSAILRSQQVESTPKLQLLLKILMFSQRRLQEKVDFPAILDVMNCHLIREDGEKMDISMREDGLSDEETD